MFGKKPRGEQDVQTEGEREHAGDASERHDDDAPNNHGGDDAEARDAGADPDETAELIADLEQRLAEAESARLRTLADYQNFQRRALVNEREAKEQGLRAALASILPVLDHFDMALGQDTAKASAEQILGGVRLIRDELSRALALHGVNPIEPEPGDEFDPSTHEAVVRHPTAEFAPGRIVQAVQVGFTIGERTLRPAKVVVADAPPEEAGDANEPGQGPENGES